MNDSLKGDLFTPADLLLSRECGLLYRILCHTCGLLKVLRSVAPQHCEKFLAIPGSKYPKQGSNSTWSYYISVFDISSLIQFSRPPFAIISCKFSGNSPTFSSQQSPFSPSCTSTTLRAICHVRVHPVRRVGTLSAEAKVARRRSIRRGNSKARSALLTAFREKILPKLPATTSGICLARIAVAACSLDEP